MREQAHELWENGKLDEALTMLRKCPQTIDVIYDIGLILFELRKIEEALDAFKQCNELDIEFAGAYYGCAICYDELNDKQLAIKYYELSIAFDPTYDSAYFHLANLLEEDDLERSIACYKKTISLSPSFYWAYANLGSLFERHFMNREAKEMFEFALKLEKSNISYFNLAVVTAKLGNIEDAIALYQKCNEIEPYAKSWFNQGVLYKEQEEYTKALLCYSNALTLDQHPDYHYNMGCVFHLQGNDETAKFHLEIAFQMEPGLIEYALDDPELYELEIWLSTLG